MIWVQVCSCWPWQDSCFRVELLWWSVQTTSLGVSDKCCMTRYENYVVVAMIGAQNRSKVASTLSGAKNTVPWKGYRKKKKKRFVEGTALCYTSVYNCNIDVVEVHILWQSVHMNILSAGQSQMFLFIYIHINVHWMSEEQKEKKASFCILNKIYIYIQTNVHNVHSTVCEVLHKTVKSKKSKKKKKGCL